MVKGLLHTGQWISILVFVAQNRNTLVIISLATVQGSLFHSLGIRRCHMVHQCWCLTLLSVTLRGFKPWRTRYESVNYGISKQDTAIWKCQNLQTNVWPSGRCVGTASGWPYISLLILTFLNGCVSVKTSLINTKLEDFVNLGVLFLNMWINSC